MQVTWVFPGLFVVLWSTGFIGAKLGLPYAEPFTFLCLRFLFVFAILLPLCWLLKARWPNRQGAVHMAIAGVLIQGGYLGGVFASLHQGMPAGVSALITGLQPVFTAVLGSWLLHERTTPRQWLGLALGLAGVGLVVGDRIAVQNLTLPAILLSVLALASITLGTVWQKRHGGAIDLRTGAAIQFAAAAVVLAPFAFLLETRNVRLERRIRLRARLAGAGALVRRDVPAVLPDPARRRDARREPVLPGAAYHRADRLAAVRRVLQPARRSRDGTRYARGLAGDERIATCA